MNVGGLDRLVTEPQRDHGAVDTVLQQLHHRSVTQHMLRDTTVALQRKVRQDLARGFVNGQAAGFAELGVSDRQHADDEIDIVPVESERLGRAHPGDSQERQERGVGAGPRGGASAQPLCRTD